MKLIRLNEIVYAFGVTLVAVILLSAWVIRRDHHQDAKIEAARIERVHQLNRINRDQCASLQNLYSVIRKTIADSELAIDTVAYYRTHPHERAAAHQRNRETLARFRTPPCPKDIIVPTQEEQ